MGLIEKEEVQKLAKLSKLSFTEEEMEALTVDMQSIVSFADMISKAEFSEKDGIEPDSLQPLREDTVLPSYPREEILKNAPTPEDGFFKLPRRNDP